MTTLSIRWIVTIPRSQGLEQPDAEGDHARRECYRSQVGEVDDRRRSVGIWFEHRQKVGRREDAPRMEASTMGRRQPALAYIHSSAFITAIPQSLIDSTGRRVPSNLDLNGRSGHAW